MTKKDLHKQFGLVGKNIDYSFSRRYFSEKFLRENRTNHQYVNYDLKSVEEFKHVLKNTPIPNGLNVTIPYKKEIIPFLDKLSEEAETIGAVNTIVWDPSGKTVGHNTDHVGFTKALLEQVHSAPTKALVLGTGGASKAIQYALDKIHCKYLMVSRNPQKNQLSYDDLNSDILNSVELIINTTPLGTFPNISDAPPIPYNLLHSKHFLFDLIYNPEETQFLKEGKSRGCKITNGYKMLVYQAEKSWELWNRDS